MVLVLLLALVLIGAALALLMRAAKLPKLRTGESLTQISAYGFAGEATADGPAGVAVLPHLAGRLGHALFHRSGEKRQAELRNLLLAAGWYRLTPATFLGYRLLGGTTATA